MLLAMKHRAYPPGIRKTPEGWQIYCRVNGRMYSKRFPENTTIAALKGHLVTLRYEAEHPELASSSAPSTPSSSTFAEDVATYLASVVHLESYKDREREMLKWVELFGSRDRKSIAPLEVSTAASQWAITKRKGGKVGYSAHTIRNRVSYLGTFYTTIDGKGAPNPALQAKRPDKPKDEDHALPHGDGAECREDVSEAIIDSLSDDGDRYAPFIKLAQARLRVMLWTGLPPALIKRLREEDLDLDNASIYVRGRKKGKGVEARHLRLQGKGVAALRELLKLNGLGAFDVTKIDKAWKRACKAQDAHRRARGAKPLNLAQTTPYWLRHTFGTVLADGTGDAQAVQRAMMHATIEQTARYIKGAAEGRLDKAVAIMDAHHRTRLKG